MNTNQRNKQLVWSFWQSLENAETDNVATIIDGAMNKQVTWNGFDPIYELNGRHAFIDGFWNPLLHSFPDLSRQVHVFMGGKSNGRIDGDISKDGKMWVSGTGYFHATFEQDYLGIPANGEKVHIRWGAFYRIENDEIIEIFCLLDLIDLMQQVGIEVLPPSKGKNHVYPPPKENDGILLEAQPETVSNYSLDHIRKFIFDGLNSFDQTDLKSMGMADYFHPNLHWFGPGGIGACLSFQEFEDFHQKPWLVAYPDRQVQDLDALIAEGHYSGGPGWAGVKATHTGKYLNCSATGNPIDFNGLDWWKRKGEQYIENWVFVDMVHLFRQFGVDLFERMRELTVKRQ